MQRGVVLIKQVKIKSSSFVLVLQRGKPTEVSEVDSMFNVYLLKEPPPYFSLLFILTLYGMIVCLSLSGTSQRPTCYSGVITTNTSFHSQKYLGFNDKYKIDPFLQGHMYIKEFFVSLALTAEPNTVL